LKTFRRQTFSVVHITEDTVGFIEREGKLLSQVAFLDGKYNMHFIINSHIDMT
jgi:hypothetical protein